MRVALMILAFLISMGLGAKTWAQTVDRAGKTEAVISAQGAESITLNEELLFLSEDLTVVGRGKVVKVSESGKTAVVKITSGRALKGMSVEKAAAQIAKERAKPKQEEASPYEPRRSMNKNFSDDPTAPLSKEDREVLRYAPVDNTQYVVGGVLGTWLGFGIGHAIQGRYSQSGWIFTAGQFGSGAAILMGAVRCIGKTRDGEPCTDGLLALGYAAFVGFKIWEIVDLWATPPSMNHRYQELRRQPSSEEPSPSPALTFDGMILPTKDGVTAGVRMTF